MPPTRIHPAVVGLGLAAGMVLVRPRRKKIFVSYDYDRDRHYRFLLSAWDRNKSFDFTFDDHSTPLVNSLAAGRIKAAITRRLQAADYMLVIVGSQTHRSKWVAWEIDKAKELGLRLIAVKIKRASVSPRGLLGANAVWATSFTDAAITNAIRRA